MKWKQGIFCVIVLLAFQAFLIWADNAPIEDLRFALLAVPFALLAGGIARSLRRR